MTVPSKLGLLCVLVSALALGACGDDEQKTAAPQTFDFRLSVQASEPSGKPVPKAPVMLDGKTIGHTDRDGRFLGVLTERQGASIELAIAPPEGYALVDANTLVTKRLKVRQDPSGAVVGETVELMTKFEPARHEHLVWVTLECGSDLPAGACSELEIKNDQDEVVATTDPFGRAHFLLTGTPDAPTTLTVDTRRPIPEGTPHYILNPAEPTFSVQFARAPEVYVLKQAFTNSAPPPVVVPVKAAKPRTQTIRKPTKATQAKAADTKKPAKKPAAKPDVIQLF